MIDSWTKASIETNILSRPTQTSWHNVGSTLDGVMICNRSERGGFVSHRRSPIRVHIPPPRVSGWGHALKRPDITWAQHWTALRNVSCDRSENGGFIPHQRSPIRVHRPPPSVSGWGQVLKRPDITWVQQWTAFWSVSCRRSERGGFVTHRRSPLRVPLSLSLYISIFIYLYLYLYLYLSIYIYI